MSDLAACKLRTTRGAVDRWRHEAKQEALAYRYWSAELCDPKTEALVRSVVFERMNGAQCRAACAWSYIAELLGMVGELEMSA